MLNKVDFATKKKIISKLKYSFKNNDLKEVKCLIEEYGGVKYTNSKILEFTDKAISELQVFPDSKYKQLLIDSANFNISRDF